MMLRFSIFGRASCYKGVIIFLAHGGGGGGVCGRNGMKASVKFLIPPGSSRKIVGPPSLFVKISCDPPPPSNHHHHNIMPAERTLVKYFTEFPLLKTALL